jgi:murein DD-endopeptidase MepM/ murein hydrolase activator NlpD
MFWGRGSLYRTAFHLFVFSLTLLIVLSGISTKLNLISAQAESLDLTASVIGGNDIMSQSGTAESVSVLDQTETDYTIEKYIVQKGDTVSSVAQLFNKNANTIKWANNLSGNNPTLIIGQVLRVPEIDGAFITVLKGDTLASIAKKYNGNSQDILDLNSSLFSDPENPVITAGMELFILNGAIPNPTVRRNVVAVSNGGSNIGGAKGFDVPRGTIINPLSSECPGYTFIRGFSGSHGGVDMSKSGGCWINAAGSGTVEAAGWGSGGVGFHVVINHGGGLKTRYYHGNGRFAVSPGQGVKAGQRIMYMGCSGHCTGTHLHFEVVINGTRVNPEAYVRLR